MLNFDSIQEGIMKDALSSPEYIATLLSQRHVQIPDASIRKMQKKNVAKGIWNRDAQVDFQYPEVVERCIFMCLRYYRTDQWKQKGYEGKDYKSLMQTGYEKRFSLSGLKNIYKTLEQWNMNSRGAKLQNGKKFNETIKDNKSEIDKLREFCFPDFCNENVVNEIASIIYKLFEVLDLTENSRFVTVSKTLHFLHPQLMIPMDRAYTANYFHNYRMPDIPKNIEGQARWNVSFHKELCAVFMKHKDLIDEISKETKYPVTKLLDNMLIGFSMYRDIFINKFSTSFIINNNQ